MKIRSRWLTKIAAFAAVATCRLLFLTCRKKYIGKILEQAIDRSEYDEFFVFCIWHDSLLIPTFATPKWFREQCCCLVSKHQDGSYLAEAMSWIGLKSVRGSSKRGGTEALREIVDSAAGMHIIVTPDGPQGPRRKMKDGAAFMAAQTGRRLVPGAFVVKHGWRIKGSWTDLLVPMPFTTVYLIMADPIEIPSGVSRLELSHFVADAQESMDRLNAEADGMYAGKSLQSPSTQAKAA